MRYLVTKPIKYLWYLCAFTIILLALVLQLSRSFIGHIDHYQQPILDYVSRQTDVDFQVSKIQASWYGLRPKVVVSGLQAHSPEDKRSLLTADKAFMEMDLLQSLWYLRPVWRAVEFDNLNIAASQDDEGVWSVVGFSSAQQSSGNWHYRSPSELFLSAERVDLNDTQLTLNFFSGKVLRADVPTISIRNNGEFHRLTASTSIDDRSVFRFYLEGTGDPKQPETFQAKAYLQLTQFPLGRLRALFKENGTSEDEHSTGIVNTQFWMDFLSPGEFTFSGNLNYSGAEATEGVYDHLLDVPVQAQVSGDYHVTEGWDMSLRNIVIDSLDDLSPVALRLSRSEAHISTQHIDLDAWQGLVNQRLDFKPVNEVLSSLSLRGELENIHVTIPLDTPAAAQIKANLNSGGADSWEGVPAVDKVSGFVQSNLTSGFLLLDTANLSFFPEEIYTQAIDVKRAKGVIGWSLSKPSNYIRIYGSELSANGSFGKARGNFLLDVPFQPNTRNANILLQIGLREANASAAKQLLPKILPKDLSQWIDSSIKQGYIEDAGLLYRGGFNDESARTYQLYGNVSNAHLKFDQNWPSVKKAKGFLLIDNERVFSRVDGGEIYPGDSLSGTVSWNSQGQGKLRVNGQGRSTLSSGLRFVRDSMLHEVTGGIFDDWRGEGGVNVDLALEIPLFNERAAIKQKVGVQFRNNKLSLGQLDLDFSEVNGRFTYDSLKGFSSNNLNGQLFNEAVSLVFENNGENDDIKLSGIGKVDSVSLSKWLNQPLDLMSSGALEYVFELNIPSSHDGQQLSKVSIYSDLKGLAIGLPAPFAKTEDQVRNFLLNMDIGLDYVSYQATLGNHFTLSSYDQDEQEPKMLISISDHQIPDFETPTLDGLEFKGRLKRLEFAPILEIFEAYLELPSQEESSPVKVNVTVDEVLYENELMVTKLEVIADSEGESWTAIVDGDGIQGAFYWDDKLAKPLLVDLDYFHWPLVAEAEDLPENGVEVDDLTDIDFSEWPEAEIKIDQLLYEEKLIGQWSFYFKPQEGGFALNNIFGQVAGFSFSGEQSEKGARMLWRRDDISQLGRTELKARIRGKNLKHLFDQWRLPPLLVSEKADMDMQLSWLGSPAYFSINRLQGETGFRLKEGVFIESNTAEATGILRMLSLFNFDTWIRRIRFDFSDVFTDGLLFDEVRGRMNTANGLLTFTEPLTVVGPSVAMTLDGTIDYPTQNLDGSMAVVLPVGGNLTLATALTAGLPTAVTFYLLRQIFKDQVDKVSTINYTITGNWNDPVIQLEEVTGDEPTEEASVQKQQAQE